MNDSQNGRWVTINGVHVYIMNGKSPMDAYIRNKGKNEKEIAKENQGIHYGDLGKARDTYFWDIDSGYRSTGHFGTGTYFYGYESDLENQTLSHFSRKDRPRHVVDFSQYNLYKPLMESDAFRLHDGLKALNYKKYDDFDFKEMQRDLIRRGISEDKIKKALSKVDEMRKKYEETEALNFKLKQDSLSTIFMKELGYNGIDVRGIKNLDNSGYGSVIYDLNNKKGGKK